MPAVDSEVLARDGQVLRGQGAVRYAAADDRSAHVLTETPVQDLTPDPATLDPVEVAPREELRALQRSRLRWSLQHAYDHVPHDRAAFDAAGFAPGDLGQLADLRHAPFTMEADLREQYPFGMLAVPREQVRRVHASSGTTVVGHTARDLDTWADLVARSLRAAGCGQG